MTVQALILAPYGRDARIAEQLLDELGVAARACADPAALAAALDDETAFVVAVEEALTGPGLVPLAAWMRDQPAWSDLPLLLLARRDTVAPGRAEVVRRLGNAQVIERPFHPGTFAAAAEAALRARRRQYQARADRQAIEAAAASLRFTLDAARLGAWEVDAGSQVLRLSPQFRAIFGRPGDTPFDLPALMESIEPEDRARVRALGAESLRTGAPYEVECRIRWPDGSVRHVEVRGRVLAPASGGRTLAGIVLDVTERARGRDELATMVAMRTAELEAAMAERERAEAALRQSQKMEAVGQLTGGVAHDFNNLLQVISSGLQLLEKAGPPDRRQRLLDAMRQATERGATLTRQLLAFSRRQELRPERVDLAAQLASMTTLLERSLRGDIRITLQVAGDLWPIDVDPTQLELAVLNIAVNARDAMPGGGVLAISARNVAGVHDGDLHGDFVRLALEDTGVGMSDEVLARVFEPFFTTKEVGSGTGLGLPQVYGFATQSHGTVRVESVPGEGTTVVIMLPRAGSAGNGNGASEPPATKGDGSDAAAEPGTTVLLVEDDDRVAELAAEMLRQLGYAYTRVRTPPAALGVLGEGQRVDVVFSDVLMPGGMNGAELAEEIGRRRPGLPVVLTTGFDGQAIAEARAEHLPLLRKPYGLGALASALRAALATTARRVADAS